jgi:aryl carrier-like protein
MRRADYQIKLRGFRIELEEIEGAIVEADPVEQAVVAVKLDGAREPRLVAYLKVKAAHALDIPELRDSLLRRLPEYMVPSYFLAVDEFPLTSNRKIDRRVLPDPEWSAAVRSSDYLAPQTATEKLLAAIWSEVLGIEQIGVNDNLLELGADSLKMFQIAARAGRKGLRVSASQLMKLRTITAIAEDLARPTDRAKPVSATGPVVRVSREKYRVPALQAQEIGSKA